MSDGAQLGAYIALLAFTIICSAIALTVTDAGHRRGGLLAALAIAAIPVTLASLTLWHFGLFPGA